ncbi:MAG: ABC transporter permease [Chloroflexota bacterium]|nr:ABC transporter permease [Chloroflexota bacterium]
MKVSPWALLTSFLAGALLLFLALPLGALLTRALSSGQLWASLTSPVIADALLLSLVTTFVSLVVIVALGTPLALVLARREFRGRELVETLVDLPIVLPPSVAGLGLLLAFGRRGAIGEPLDALGVAIPFTTVAVVLAQIFVSAPFYVRAARAGFRSVDREVEDAARVDGAGSWALLRRVTVPLAWPAIGAGLVLAWARALGEFGATIMFAGNITGRTQTLPLVVYSEFQVSVDSSVAAAAVLVLAALGILVGVRLTRWRSALDLRTLS